MLNTILDEEAFAKEIKETGEIGTKPTVAIIILIKYYHKEGMDKHQIRDEIESFMLKHYKDFNSVKWQKKLDYYVNKYSQNKYTLKKVESISISENELQHISKINNLKLERLAFVLLVYSKIANALNPENNNWVRKSSSEIFKSSKIVERTIEQQLTIKRLADLGYISFARTVDSESIHIEFVDTIGEAEIEISDMREFILEYLRWKGDKIGKCEECGKLFKQTTNAKKQCRECTKKNRLTYKAKKEKEYRENKKRGQVEIPSPTTE